MSTRWERLCSFFVLGWMSTNTATAQEQIAESEDTVPTRLQAAEGYVSEDAVELLLKRDVVINEIGSTEFSGGVFFNEDRDLVVSATGLSRIGAEDLRRFVIHGGIRIYASFLHTEDEDVLGAAVGGTARYILGEERGSSIVLSAFYAPDILTFGTSDGVYEATLRFEMGIRSRTSVFVGYRMLEFDLAQDRRVDDSFHIGARYRL